jgi:lysophospholipase L1-like esterase
MSPGLVAAKLALGPILLPQARRVHRIALRLPEPAGAREGLLGEGEPALRLLVVGDSSAAGVGVADQVQALALPLAHRLHEALGAPVAWQLVAKSGINSVEARGLVAAAALQRADVAVVALGVNDVSSQTSPRRFAAQLAALWDDLRARTGARWAVFNGLPPMHMLPLVPHPLRWYLGRCAQALDDAVRSWSRSQGLGYCALRWADDPRSLAEDGFHPGPALYPQWAQHLTQSIMEGREQWTRG